MSQQRPTQTSGSSGSPLRQQPKSLGTGFKRRISPPLNAALAEQQPARRKTVAADSSIDERPEEEDSAAVSCPSSQPALCWPKKLSLPTASQLSCVAANSATQNTPSKCPRAQTPASCHQDELQLLQQKLDKQQQQPVQVGAECKAALQPVYEPKHYLANCVPIQFIPAASQQQQQQSSSERRSSAGLGNASSGGASNWSPPQVQRSSSTSARHQCSLPAAACPCLAPLAAPGVSPAIGQAAATTTTCCACCRRARARSLAAASDSDLKLQQQHRPALVAAQFNHHHHHHPFALGCSLRRYSTISQQQPGPQPPAGQTSEAAVCRRNSVRLRRSSIFGVPHASCWPASCNCPHHAPLATSASASTAAPAEIRVAPTQASGLLLKLEQDRAAAAAAGIGPAAPANRRESLAASRRHTLADVIHR